MVGNDYLIVTCRSERHGDEGYSFKIRANAAVTLVCPICGNNILFVRPEVVEKDNLANDKPRVGRPAKNRSY